MKVNARAKNYFLYDDSNIINHNFYTELNKKSPNLWTNFDCVSRHKGDVHGNPPKKALNLKFKTRSTKKILSFN